MRKINRPAAKKAPCRRSTYRQEMEKKQIKLLFKPFDFDGWEFEMPSLDVAENQKRSEEGLAASQEREGLLDLAKKTRERAASWQKLGGLPEDEAKQFYAQWYVKASDTIDALLTRSQSSDNALSHLSLILSQLLNGLYALAAHGNKQAGDYYMSAVGEAVLNFESLADNKPETFLRMARVSASIPGMISRNTEIIADNKRLLKKLQQGEDCQLANLPNGKKGGTWKFRNRAISLAMQLQSHIQSSRIIYRFNLTLVQDNADELSAWRQKAMKLEPFSAGTWEGWADIAWQVLLEATNEKPYLHKAILHLGESAGKKKAKFGMQIGEKTRNTNIQTKIEERVRVAMATIAGARM
jgi:hypothetical protein